MDCADRRKCAVARLVAPTRGELRSRRRHLGLAYAGIFMWMPVGLIYALAALALAARWISTSPLQKEIGHAAR
jgi:hypothetical protein